MTTLTLTPPALVVLIGLSSSGKSTLATRVFPEGSVVEKDRLQASLSANPGNRVAADAARTLVLESARAVLQSSPVAVIDAANVRRADRLALVALAREVGASPAAVLLDLDEDTCVARHLARGDRHFGLHVLRSQLVDLRRHRAGLEEEGFEQVVCLGSAEQAAAFTVEFPPTESTT